LRDHEKAIGSVEHPRSLPQPWLKGPRSGGKKNKRPHLAVFSQYAEVGIKEIKRTGIRGTGTLITIS